MYVNMTDKVSIKMYIIQDIHPTTRVLSAKFRTLQYGAGSGQRGRQQPNTGPTRTGRVLSGPSRPICVGNCQKPKVSESAGLVGKSLVRPVGVLWTTLGPPIGHMEQQSKNPTIITNIMHFPIQPFKGSL